ncbi:hypothetical protein AMTRI_Chr09g37830 [Amborella trichopoda]
MLSGKSSEVQSAPHNNEQSKWYQRVPFVYNRASDEQVNGSSPQGAGVVMHRPQIQTLQGLIFYLMFCLGFILVFPDLLNAPRLNFLPDVLPMIHIGISRFANHSRTNTLYNKLKISYCIKGILLE